MAKANPDKVNPAAARAALQNAKGDRKAAYSQYIILHFRATGKLAPGCDAKDLIAFYEREDTEDKDGM